MLTMELASRIRWILILIVGVLFLFLIGWGLFSIANNLFRGTGDRETAITEPAVDVASASTAIFTVEGPIVAAENHRSYTITVSQNVVNIKVLRNYGQNIVAERSYVNNAQSFESFLKALENLNVTARQRGTSADDDFKEIGVCPSGRRFIVELDNELRRWSTSCTAREGTAGFTMNQVRSLFDRQVPDLRELTRGTSL